MLTKKTCKAHVKALSENLPKAVSNMLNISPPPDDMKSSTNLSVHQFPGKHHSKMFYEIEDSIFNIKIEANNNTHILSHGGGSTDLLRLLNLKEN